MPKYLESGMWIGDIWKDVHLIMSLEKSCGCLKIMYKNTEIYMHILLFFRFDKNYGCYCNIKD